MTTQDVLQSMIDQITELPNDIQAELLLALVEMRSQHLGIDERDGFETRHA
jgi:hypothetical protein